MSSTLANPLSASSNDSNQEDNDSSHAEGAVAHDSSALGLTFDHPQFGDQFDTVYDRLRKNILSHSGREDADEQDQQGNRGEMAVGRSSGTLLGDLEQLRKWKKESERDCDKLRRENQRLGGEIALLKKLSDERYRALLGEKAALAEKIYGPAKLPIEILLNIAGFVVGNNDFGTMLSFNLMSKRIREESKPVLYETIAVHDRAQSGRQAYLDAAHYIKFLYCSTDGTSRKRLLKQFTGIRCIIRTAPQHQVMDESSGEVMDASEPAQISIYGKVYLSTVVSLLAFSTPSSDGPASPKLSIQALTKIELLGAGGLMEDQLSKDNPILPQSEEPCLISTYRCESRDDYQQSVRELARFVSAVDTDPKADELIRSLHGERYKLTIEVDAGYQLEAWLERVHHIVRKHPRTYIRVTIRGDTGMTRADFQATLRDAVSAYLRTWEDIKDDVASLYMHDSGPWTEDELFTITYKTNRWGSEGNQEGDQPENGDGRELEIREQVVNTYETPSFRVQMLEIVEGEDSPEMPINESLIDLDTYDGDGPPFGFF